MQKNDQLGSGLFLGIENSPGHYLPRDTSLFASEINSPNDKQPEPGCFDGSPNTINNIRNSPNSPP
jgi:hypothetical protein